MNDNASLPANLRDRLIQVEADLRNHRRESNIRFDRIDDGLDDLKKSVNGFTNLLNQAKGARWLILALLALGAWLAGLGDAIRHMLK